MFRNGRLIQVPTDVYLSRRKFMLGIGALAGSVALAACAKPEPPMPTDGIPLPTDEAFLSEPQLTYELNNLVKAKERLSLENPKHASVIRSLYKHSIAFGGVSDLTAEKRAQRIILAKDTSICKDPMCTRSNNNTIDFYIDPSYVTNLTSDDDGGWNRLIHEVTHEGGHAAVDRVEQSESWEDYGVLGKWHNTGSRRGFFRGNEKLEAGNEYEPVDLFTLDTKYQDDGKKIDLYWFEELYADTHKGYFLRDRLSSVSGADDYTSANYWFLVQAVVDMMDDKGINGNDSWQEYFDGQIKFENFSRYHRVNARQEFFEEIGKVIAKRNGRPDSETLSVEDMRALGLVAFTDFALGIGLLNDNHKILIDLVERPLNPRYIYTKATELKVKMNKIVVERPEMLVKRTERESVDMKMPIPSRTNFERV